MKEDKQPEDVKSTGWSGPCAVLRTGGWALLVLVAASLAVKLLLVWMVSGMACSHDQCDYLDLASGLLAGGGLSSHDGYLWPPGFIAFLAACKALFGEGLTPPRLFQVMASTATVPLLYLAGYRMGDRQRGLLAAGVFAFYPNLLAFTHLLWPATLFLFFLVAGFLVLIWPEEVSFRHAALAGFCLGVAAYLKGIALYFTPLAAVWILVWGGSGFQPGPSPGRDSPARRVRTLLRRRGRVAALLMATLFLTLLPWTVRNWRTYDRFLLLDATAGRNLYIGTNLAPPSNWDLGFNERRRIHGGRPRCQSQNIVDRDRCEVRHALEFMKLNTGRMISRIPLKLADLLNPSSFVIRHVRLGKYPYTFAVWQARGITLVAALSWMAVAGLGLLGLVLPRQSGGVILMRLLVVYELILHSLTFGLTRFRLPMVPFLILAAASLLGPVPTHRVFRAPIWRLCMAGLLLVVLVLLWAARWSTVFDLF